MWLHLTSLEWAMSGKRLPVKEHRVCWDVYLQFLQLSVNDITVLNEKLTNKFKSQVSEMFTIPRNSRSSHFVELL